MNTSLTPQEILVLKKEVPCRGKADCRQMERRVPTGTRPGKICGCGQYGWKMGE